MKKEIEIAMGEIARSDRIKEMNVIRSGQVAPLGPYKCLSSLFSYISAGQAVISITCVMPYEGEIAKMRLTFQPGLEDQRQTLASAFQGVGKFLFLQTLGDAARKQPEIAAELAASCINNYMSTSLVDHQKQGMSPEKIERLAEDLLPSLRSYCGCAANHYLATDYHTDNDAQKTIRIGTMWLLYGEQCPRTGLFERMMQD